MSIFMRLAVLALILLWGGGLSAMQPPSASPMEHDVLERQGALHALDYTNRMVIVSGDKYAMHQQFDVILRVNGEDRDIPDGFVISLNRHVGVITEQGMIRRLVLLD